MYLLLIKTEVFNFDILLDERSYENILFYNILCKTLKIKVDGFIRIYDGNRYLVLFGREMYNAIYDRIRYLNSLKSGIAYVISHTY